MEQTLFTQFLLQFGKSSPLFLLIFLGFALSRWFGFNKTASTVLSKFAFNIALPAMLFRFLSEHRNSQREAKKSVIGENASGTENCSFYWLHFQKISRNKSSDKKQNEARSEKCDQ